MNILEAILISLSLCADCFAVSLCSSVTLKKVDARSVGTVALVFGVIQAGFMLIGWLLGAAFYGYVERISGIIGFLLLLYVGGAMLYEGIKGESEGRNLSGWKNIIIGGVATSIDAMAVGVSQSMDGAETGRIMVLSGILFLCTVASVVLGILSGHKLCGGRGARVSRAAEIIGGIVLIIIGVRILL